MHSLQASLFELDISVRLGLYFLCHVYLFVWARFVVAPAKVGTARILRSAPIVPVLLFLTFLFDVNNPAEFIPAAYCTHNFLWLTASKLWSFCLNRGQLVGSYEAGSKTAFALGLLSPVTIAFDVKPVEKEKKNNHNQPHAYKDAQFTLPTFSARQVLYETLQTALHIAGYVGLMVVMDVGYFKFVESGRDFWRDFCLCWFLYGCSAFIEEVTNLFILITSGIKLDKSFHYPWMAQSVSEFWSRRYNLVFGRTLRELAYDPIVEGTCIHGSNYFKKSKPSHLRRALGVLVTFTVSGLIHMFALQHVLATEPFVLYGIFFVINGITVVMENTLKVLVRSSEYGSAVLKMTPKWIYHLYTVVLMFSLSHLLFWPEIMAEVGGEMMLNGTMKFLGIR